MSCTPTYTHSLIGEASTINYITLGLLSSSHIATSLAKIVRLKFLPTFTELSRLLGCHSLAFSPGDALLRNATCHEMMRKSHCQYQLCSIEHFIIIATITSYLIAYGNRYIGLQNVGTSEGELVLWRLIVVQIAFSHLLQT